MKIFLLNGPPRSGKDTLALEITIMCDQEGIRSGSVAIGYLLKTLTHHHYALLHNVDGDAVPGADDYEEEKDETNEFFFGLTPRQAWVNMHDFLKQHHGMDFLVNQTIKQLMPILQKHGTQVLIVTDVGNVHEAQAFQPHGETILVRVAREGYTWTDDRRVPVPASACGGRILNYMSSIETNEIRYWIKKEVFTYLMEQ